MTDNKSHSSLFLIYPTTARAAVIFIALVFTVHAVLLIFFPGCAISSGVRIFCSLTAAAASYAALQKSSQRFLRLTWYTILIAVIFLALMNSVMMFNADAAGTSGLSGAAEILSGLSLIALTASFILLSQSYDSVTRIRRHVSIACIIWVTIAALALPFRPGTTAHESGLLSIFSIYLPCSE